VGGTGWDCGVGREIRNSASGWDRGIAGWEWELWEPWGRERVDANVARMALPQVAFNNNPGKYTAISHADGNQYYPVDTRAHGVLQSVNTQARKVMGDHNGAPVVTVHMIHSGGTPPPALTVETDHHHVDVSTLGAPNPQVAVGSGADASATKPFDFEMESVTTVSGGGEVAA